MKDRLIIHMDDSYSEYLKDESRVAGHCRSISFPESEEEIIDVLKVMNEAGELVTTQGARTGLAAGAVPRGGHVLNLSRMKKVTAMRYEKGSFYLRVHPGMVLSELRKLIESKGFDDTDWDRDSLAALEAFQSSREYFFSPDPTESTATLGGMVACNASGARSYKYGATREYISGLRVILADGDVLEVRRGESFAYNGRLTLKTLGGKEITLTLPTYRMPKSKNASGYFVSQDMDAIDLFIGSDGTLGVISEIEIRLLPLPSVIWGTTCFFAKASSAISFIDNVRECKKLKSIAAIEYFDKNALDILRCQREKGGTFASLPEIPDKCGSALYIELHCSSEEKALEDLFTIGDIMKSIGENENNTLVARTSVDKDKLLFFRHAVPESVNMLIDERKRNNPSITKLGTDMSVPDEYLSKVMDLYTSMLAERKLDYAIWGHIGNNHLHVNILPKNDSEYCLGKELYARWAELITKMGGAVSAEHGVGKLKAGFLMTMYGKRHIEEMRALKRSLDSKGILGTYNLFTP